MTCTGTGTGAGTAGIGTTLGRAGTVVGSTIWLVSSHLVETCTLTLTMRFSQRRERRVDLQRLGHVLGSRIADAVVCAHAREYTRRHMPSSRGVRRHTSKRPIPCAAVRACVRSSTSSGERGHAIAAGSALSRLIDSVAFSFIARSASSSLMAYNLVR
jgi:hypothetical protein